MIVNSTVVVKNLGFGGRLYSRIMAARDFIRFWAEFLNESLIRQSGESVCSEIRLTLKSASFHRKTLKSGEMINSYLVHIYNLTCLQIPTDDFCLDQTMRLKIITEHKKHAELTFSTLNYPCIFYSCFTSSERDYIK